MEQLQVKTAIYVGDTIDDIVAASAADILSVGVVENAETGQRLKDAGAIKVLDSVNRIVELIE